MNGRVDAAVDGNFAGTDRLDRYIASIPGGMNRSRLKACARSVKVNGRPEKISFRVRAGDRIEIEWDDGEPSSLEAEDIPLSIIYEDSDVAVVDKAQGMVTHPAAGNWSGTLANALLFHWGRDGGNFARTDGDGGRSLRPGIVHRLDKDTSGVIVTAKSRAAEEWLQSEFRKRSRVRKEYIAITRGRPPAASGEIRAKIARDPRDRKKFKAFDGEGEGKDARTLYHCLACYGDYSFLRLRIKTGRTHQIRVHLKHIGCPILGDAIYGGRDALFPRATLMLHARSLAIRLPRSKKISVFIAPVPERFKKISRALKKKFARFEMK